MTAANREGAVSTGAGGDGKVDDEGDRDQDEVVHRWDSTAERQQASRVAHVTWSLIEANSASTRLTRGPRTFSTECWSLNPNTGDVLSHDIRGESLCGIGSAIMSAEGGGRGRVAGMVRREKTLGNGAPGSLWEILLGGLRRQVLDYRSLACESRPRRLILPANTGELVSMREVRIQARST